MHASPMPTSIARLAPRSALAPMILAIESEAMEASCELVYQRDDLVQAASDENNRLLERALQVDGLPPLVRELIAAALAIEIEEDAAARRAEMRRLNAHGYTQAAASACERIMTGRGGKP